MRIITIFIFSAFFILQSCKENTVSHGSSAQQGTIDKDTIESLASWNDGPSKKAIMDFVKKTTTDGSADFVPVSDRIACFDNDGTLWSEQPIYFQMAFALDQVKSLAAEHPEWKTTQPFKAVIEDDLKTVMAGGEKSMGTILAATHSGMTMEEFTASVKNWMSNAKHPKTGKPYNEMIYQPMVELLDYLRANGYKTFIVSGGGIDFMRAWAEAAYGIPPYQIVGSVGDYRYEMKDGKGILLKQSEITFIDDKAGKPVGIQHIIGKIPVFAGGNSDGDYEMLQYTTTAAGPRLGMIVHHTDSLREWAYDRGSHIGKLEKGLDDAQKYNWLIVDMLKDWKVIYPYELKKE